jgi:uncharacterized protein (DUF427 family)
MSLAMITGPLGTRPSGVANFERSGPAHALYLEPTQRRIRGVFAGETVVDSRRAQVLHESGHLPRYYFPREDVRADLLESTDHHTNCPFKGDASYVTLRVGARSHENAAWEYPEPIDGAPALRGLVCFYWEAMDEWWQEDERAVGHAQDPYHRIDVLPSSAHVLISIAGEVVAESTRASALFETGLPTRWYLPREDVRGDLLEPSEKVTTCAYKGHASYASVRAGETFEDDVVWWYPEPLTDAERVGGLLCFFDERVDVDVDGVRQERPRTPWSR